MSDVINIRLELTDEPTPENSRQLQKLRFELQQDVEVPCNLEMIDGPEHTQDAGLAAAIAIVGLSLSLFDRVLALVRHYKEQSQRGCITVNAEGYSWTKCDLTDAEIEEIVREIEAKKVKDIVIKVD